MPFKSQAQRRRFAELLVKGEISPETFEEWNRETGGRKLPERVTPAWRAKKKAAPSRARAKRKTSASPARKSKRR
jgi:hypothetical protein